MQSMSVQARLSAVDESYTSTLKRALGLNEGFLGSVKKIASGIGVYKLAAAGVDMLKGSLDGAIRRYDTLNNYPKVMTSLGYSTDAAKKSVDELSKGVEGLPTTLDSIVQSAQMLTSSLGDIDKGTKTAVALNDMFLAGGQGAEAASRALTQYNQILAKGKVDQQSWNTLVEVAPGQMDQLAKSLLGATAGQKDLYAALQDGTLGVEDLNDAIIQLDKEGGDGFSSFAEQAKAATGGIGTSLTNIKTAVVKGVESMMRSINETLESAGLPSIEGFLGQIKEGIESAFNFINGVIQSLGPVFQTIVRVGKSVVGPFKEAFEAVKASLSGAFNVDVNPIQIAQAVIEKFGSVLQKVAGFIKEHASAFGVLIKVLPFVVAGFTALMGIRKIIGIFSGVSKAAQAVGAASGTMSVNIARAIAAIPPLTLLAIGAAIAIVAAGFALLATQSTGVAEIIRSIGEAIAIVMVGIAEAINTVLPGLTAAIIALAPVITDCIATILPLITSALAVLLPLITDFVTAVLPLITDFVATILTIITTFIATVLPPILAAVESIVSIVVEGIASIITAVTPIVEIIGGVIIAVVDAIARMVEAIAPILEAVAEIITAFGETVSSILESAGSAFESFGEAVATIMEGISTVITSVGEAISGILDSIAGIFDSMGQAALNAGIGISMLASGISRLVGLSLSDLVATLASVAKGLDSIGETGSGLKSAASAMRNIASGMKQLGSAGTAAISSITRLFTTLKTGSTQSASVVKQLGTTITTSLRSATTQAVNMARQMTTGMVNAIRSGANGVRSAVATIAGSIRGQYGAMYSAGSFIAQGLVNGMNSQLGRVRQIAAQLGNTAADATRKASGVSSPSTVFAKIGEFIGMGLVNGIESMIPDVQKAGDALAYATGFNTNYTGHQTYTLDTELTIGSMLMDAIDELRDAVADDRSIELTMDINGRAFAKATTADIQSQANDNARLDAWRTGVKA